MLYILYCRTHAYGICACAIYNIIQTAPRVLHFSAFHLFSINTSSTVMCGVVDCTMNCTRKSQNSGLHVYTAAEINSNR